MESFPSARQCMCCQGHSRVTRTLGQGSCPQVANDLVGAHSAEVNPCHWMAELLERTAGKTDGDVQGRHQARWKPKGPSRAAGQAAGDGVGQPHGFVHGWLSAAGLGQSGIFVLCGTVPPMWGSIHQGSGRWCPDLREQHSRGPFPQRIEQ